MHRKIIRQGVRGRTISLPIDWVRRHGLSVGDEVALREQGPSLLISPGTHAPRTFSYQFTEYDPVLARTVVAYAFRAGYELIELEGIPRSEAEKLTRSFRGLVVRAHSTDRTCFAVILKDEPCEVASLLRLLFQLAGAVLAELCQEWERAKPAESLRRRGLRVRDSALRIIAAKQYGGPLQFTYYDLVTQLEKIVAHSVYFSAYVRKARPPRSELAAEALAMLRDYQRAFGKREFRLLARMNRRWHRRLGELFPARCAAREDDAGVQRFAFLLMRGLRQVSSRLLVLAAEEAPEPLGEGA